MKTVVITLILIILGGVLWLSTDMLEDHTDTTPEHANVEQTPSMESSQSDAVTNFSNKNLREEASDYIETITETQQTVKIEKANDFVTAEQTIELLDKKVFETLTIKDLENDTSLDKETAITVVRKTREIEPMSVTEMVRESRGELEETVNVLIDGNVVEKEVAELIQQPEKVFDVVKEKETLEVITVNELLSEKAATPTETVTIIRKPYTLSTTTVNELLMNDDAANKAYEVFYVRNVSQNDSQGIWGIVHRGLVKNFASGIAIRRGKDIEHYQINIPADADEMTRDNNSSYLGQVIQRKSQESHVYNFHEGKMGKNPDLILPGQQIVIIGFSTDELISIYEHFVARAEG